MHDHHEAKPHRDGHYRCGFTGQTFPYVYSADRSTAKAAKIALENHQATYTEAAEARAGRKLSIRELMQGGAAVQDSRSTRERIEAANSFKQPTRDENDNPLAPTLAELQAELVSLPSHGYRVAEKRAALERRIHMIAPQVAAKDAEIQTRRERETITESIDYKTAVTYGEAWLLRLKMDADAPQEWIQAAKDRLARLQADLDVRAFTDATYAWEDVRQAALDSKLRILDADAAAVREKANEFRRELKDDAPPVVDAENLEVAE